MSPEQRTASPTVPWTAIVAMRNRLIHAYFDIDSGYRPGVQINAPMYLDVEGTLSPSAGKPFTHILKPAGTSGYDALPLVEWAECG